MALQRRQLKQDLLWLKWSLLLLSLTTVVAIVVYFSATYFRNSMQRQEFNTLSELDLLRGQVREIESAEQIIINNIGRFNAMARNSVLEEEDRVQLLEEMRLIRNKYQLFPIAVEIQQQNRILLSYAANVVSPPEQISLRSSQIRVQLPLLHEEDLSNFLTDFLGSGRLMLSNYCVIDETALGSDDFLKLIEHQLATCDFYWYTLRREPYTGI